MSSRSFAPARAFHSRAARAATVVSSTVLLFTLACGGGGTEPRVATSIVATSTQTLNGVVGSPVEPVPTVVVRDQHSQPLPNVSVTFAAAGGGSVTPGTVVTDAFGVARPAAWVLGPTVGANALTATVSGLAPVQFTATAGAGAATVLTRLDGTDGQTAFVATGVVNSPAVRATDQHGNPVAGVVIVFTVASGGGTLGNPVATTNSSGIAMAGPWILGTTAGPNVVLASIPGGQSVAFTATGIAGPAASITKFSGDHQAAYPGRALPLNPTVVVRDAYNNPKSGVTVTFTVHTGGGLVSSASALTGATGMASVSWTLGSHLANTLRVSIPDVPVTFFNATGLIPILSAELASPGLSPGGTTQATATLTDNTGGAITGRTITWSTDDAAVATVNSAGVVTAHATGGACITATVDGASRCVNLQVGGAVAKSPAPWVEMEVESTTLSVGSSVHAIPVPRDADGDYIVIHGTVHWGSHNPPVAVVTREGWIIALAVGQASISVTIDGVTHRRLFTVTP